MQSCCNSFGYSTNCFVDVLVVVAVVASYTQSLVSCSALFKAFLDLTSCKRRIWFLESGKFLLVESGIRELCLWNPEFWVSESRIQLKNLESHLESRIQVPLTKTGIQYLESGICGVDSRIQDCLGFPNIGRSTL